MDGPRAPRRRWPRPFRVIVALVVLTLVFSPFLHSILHALFFTASGFNWTLAITASFAVPALVTYERAPRLLVWFAAVLLFALVMSIVLAFALPYWTGGTAEAWLAVTAAVLVILGAVAAGEMVLLRAGWRRAEPELDRF